MAESFISSNIKQKKTSYQPFQGIDFFRGWPDGWPDGRVAGWPGGRMAGWLGGRVAESTIEVQFYIPLDPGGFVGQDSS